MAKVTALAKRLYARVPAFVKKDGARAALLFVASFALTAKPLIPSLIATPSFGGVRALLVPALLAGVRSAQPIVAKLTVEIAYKIVAHVEAKKPVAPPAAPAPAPVA